MHIMGRFLRTNDDKYDTKKNLNNIWEKLENQPIIFILESEQSDGVIESHRNHIIKG